MKKVFAIVSILALLLAPILTSTLFAQPPSPPAGATTTGPGCWPPPCVPIDGGISFLIAAGIGLGVKKVHASRKKI